MTREEAKLTLQENFGLLSFEYPGRISEAIKIAIEVLSQLSLPSDLDDAAEAHRRKVYWGDSEMCQFVREVFKSGAEWVAGQGETIDGEIITTSDYGWETIRIPKKLYPLGTKVTVQIRKKQ